MWSYPNGQPVAPVSFEAYGAAGDIDDLMAGDHLSGLLVVKNGEARLERYAKGLTREGRWQSSSMVKSLVSTLIGAAVLDGLIDIDRTVPEYLPDFAATVYEGVAVRHLLTMTSRIEWSENTDDLKSDVAGHYIEVIAARQHGAIADYLKTRRRAVEPGTSYYYNTGDPFPLSPILSTVTGTTVAEYCSTKIWQPMGMERDGFFILDGDEPFGDEIICSCCVASLRDYAKWGTLMIADGAALGQRILPGAGSNSPPLRRRPTSRSTSKARGGGAGPTTTKTPGTGSCGGVTRTGRSRRSAATASGSRSTGPMTWWW